MSLQVFLHMFPMCLHFPFQVLCKLSQLICTEALAKIGGGNVFYAVGFIKNDNLKARNDFSKPSLLDHQISKKEVMVDNNDFGLGRSSSKGVQVTILRMKTLGTKTLFRRGGYGIPEQIVVSHPLQFGPIAKFSLSNPLLNLFRYSFLGRFQIGYVGEILMVSVQAEVILPPLHEHSIHIKARGFFEKGNIFEENLLLKVLSPRGYHGLLAAEHKRDKVAEGLSGSSARFNDGRSLFPDGLFNQTGHFNLCGTEFKPVKGSGNQTVGT